MGHRDNLDAAIGYIGDRSPAQARDWRQGFELAGWACARAGHSVPPGGVIGKGSWDEDWTWTSWEPANTPFGDCLQSKAAEAPPPTRALLLTVAIVP